MKVFEYCENHLHEYTKYFRFLNIRPLTKEQVAFFYGQNAQFRQKSAKNKAKTAVFGCDTMKAERSHVVFVPRCRYAAQDAVRGKKACVLSGTQTLEEKPYEC